MSKELDRREFGKVLGIGLLTAALGKEYQDGGFDPELLKLFEEAPLPEGEEALFPRTEAFTMEGATKFYLEMDKLADKLKDKVVDPPESLQDMQAFAYEVIPYFMYEGIVDEQILDKSGSYPVWVPQRLVYPEIDMEQYPGGNAFHVAGQAHCRDAVEPRLTLNLRYFNPWSPWSGRHSAIGTLVHELGHIQQASCDPESADKETSTQLVAAEVLAAMTVHRNKHTLLPFISMMQEFSGSFLLGGYIHEHGAKGIDLYKEEILSKAADSEYRIKSFEKSMSHWSTNIRALQFVLREYGAKPYWYLNEAMAKPLPRTRKLPLPNMSRSLTMDDTKSVLKDIHLLVRQYDKILE